MKCIIIISLIIIALEILCSCSATTSQTPSGLDNARLKRVRVKKLWYERGHYILKSDISVISVDTMYRIGDTISLTGNKYGLKVIIQQ